jgi:2-polyprenyl-3-methyl-5-hydroxy-6-metoxy-1,4-benzoquinol methylase
MIIGTLDLSPYPSLERLVATQLEVWPEHRGILTKSVTVRTVDVLLTSDDAAGLILKIIEHHLGSIKEVCEDYRFLCEKMILAEEWYFRRHGTYRLSTFAEAEREYYSNPGFMKQYMNGLLLSSIFWLNHANALHYYITRYLKGNPPGYRHLEVGPGHGLLLYYAASDGRCSKAYGWDVSAGSIAATRRALEAVGIASQVNLVNQDVFEAAKGNHAFESIVVSEVLEHLERPLDALKNLYHCLVPGGRILVNMPANSPSPDHLYLLREPEETLDLMKAGGFEVQDYRLLPMAGYSLEQCRKHKLTINCSAIGIRPIAG